MSVKKHFYPFRWLVLMIGALILVGSIYESYAGQPSPTEIVQNTSDKVIARLRAQGHDIANNIQAAYGIINQLVAPHIDSVGMARSALGRQQWEKATPSQRKRFTNAFKTTVMRTYATALSQYTNETVRVLPIRGNIAGKSRVLVKTQILGDGPPIAVNYRLILKNNTWKVYDFDVEGVSMLRSFRSQFSTELAKSGNLDVLIKDLQQHNRAVQ